MSKDLYRINLICPFDKQTEAINEALAREGSHLGKWLRAFLEDIAERTDIAADDWQVVPITIPSQYEPKIYLAALTAVKGTNRRVLPQHVTAIRDASAGRLGRQLAKTLASTIKVGGLFAYDIEPGDAPEPEEAARKATMSELMNPDSIDLRNSWYTSRYTPAVLAGTVTRLNEAQRRLVRICELEMATEAHDQQLDVLATALRVKDGAKADETMQDRVAEWLDRGVDVITDEQARLKAEKANVDRELGELFGVTKPKAVPRPQADPAYREAAALIRKAQHLCRCASRSVARQLILDNTELLRAAKFDVNDILQRLDLKNVALTFEEKQQLIKQDTLMAIPAA